MELQYVTLNGANTPFLGIYLHDKIEFILGLYDDGFSFVDSRMNKIAYEEAPSIGFQGKEKLGSARGYIWSRSLPVFIDICKALHISPDYLLQDELSENEISKIHEIEMLWKDAPLSKQELALAMIKAALKHPEQ